VGFAILQRSRFNPSWLCGIHSGQSDIGAGLFTSLISFHLLITILPLLHIHPLPPPEMCDSQAHEAYYHILSFQVEGFISDPALGWLQSNVVISTKTKWKLKRLRECIYACVHHYFFGISIWNKLWSSLPKSLFNSPFISNHCH
jgi:hypothetical protein